MKCFLDMDGVIADFVPTAARAHNRPNPYVDPKNWGVYDVEKLWGMSTEEFWKPTENMAFWEGIPKTAEADQIVELAKKAFGEENIAILTAPSEFDGCMAAKKHWVERYYPEFAKRIIFASAATKQFIAGPGKLLIDDRYSNCEEWSALGGNAILMPQPWNRNAGLAEEAVETVKFALRFILNEGDNVNVQKSS